MLERVIKMKYIHPFFIGIPNVVLLVIVSLISIKEIISYNNLPIKIMGVILVLTLIILEKISHISHKQAHAGAEKIKKLVTTGIYSKIRHPIYLGWIIFNIGAFLIIENFQSLVIALIFTLVWYLEARQEERFMEKKFKNYKKYKEKTGMFFPRVC
ncbi:hypothetical protein COV15_01180 [Candidatus Woesearchaeota archaeon CG10_big_fil_rev_8_21_14_0_10_34_12]|nr:MAG: hypothetical protein COV15_01180 [Candidatus Woesearchaeota archaeon CG10_big_fil_rev_8_21_14_0_10_34_12]